VLALLRGLRRCRRELPGRAPGRELPGPVHERDPHGVGIPLDAVLYGRAELDHHTGHTRLELGNAERTHATAVDAVPACAARLGAVEVDDEAAVVHHEVTGLDVRVD